MQYPKLPQFASGLRAAWRAGYTRQRLRQDIMAGLTIGTVAVPLSMALAIAIGVPPQHGLYTALVAGAIIALTGGSRFNVSGPTAAFVVILLPIVKQYGLGGLLLATMMAGLLLIFLGLSRLGKLIQFVPYPVVLGFTSGIAVVIAVLQLPDLLGLQVDTGAHFVQNFLSIVTALPSLQPVELGIGLLTLVVILGWPKLRLPLPAPLVGLIIGALVAYGLQWLLGQDSNIATIATRFSWEANGASGVGIPPIAPSFAFPWQLPGPGGEPLAIDFALIQALLGPALAIAMLGAIESLLCAVVADSLTHTKHDPNSELVGQGLGNLIAPLFGGITATAAMARTATNIRSGAYSPIAAVVHSLVVLLAIVIFAQALGYVPMASLAALLVVVAWNMSESRHFMHLLRAGPASDVAVLLTCFGLTVVFDMVLAVAVGISLAAALFIRRMAQLTRTDNVDREMHPLIQQLPASVSVYDINGPLFFGATEKALTSLHIVDPTIKTVIIDMVDVPSMDATAIVGLRSLIEEMRHQGIGLIFAGLPARLVVKLRRAGVRKQAGVLSYTRNLEVAVKLALRWQQPVASEERIRST